MICQYRKRKVDEIMASFLYCEHDSHLIHVHRPISLGCICEVFGRNRLSVFYVA